METNNLNSSGRYRSLIASIAIFLALIGALLAFTFYTSSLIGKNTALIDTSHRVANNTQAVIKDIFDLQNSYGEDVNSPHIQTVLKRLEQNTQQIDEHLAAMRTGGVVTDAAGDTFDLPEITDPDTLADLNAAESEWNDLKPKVQAYLEVADDISKDSSVPLAVVGEQAKTSSLSMNESLDLLTRDVFEESEAQADLIRMIQLLGVAAILGYFLIFVFFFVRRLRESDSEALAARRETQEIMQTVGTGLFLLDKDLRIGQQYSNALAEILGTNKIAGENLANILRGRISEKDLATTRQFIDQLYNPRVKEKLVNDLNPLSKVMLHSNAPDKAGESNYLDFKFSRVYEGKEIARILVNVIDVSEEVRLEKRLELERSQNDMQIEMLTTILNVQPRIINDFINNTKIHIDKMNNILKNPGSSQFELESKLKSIYREVHSLKGEASALKLHSFTQIASEAEDKLHVLQNQSSLSGNDFLPLAVHLDDLISLSNTIETLGERINQSSLAQYQANSFDQNSRSRGEDSGNLDTENLNTENLDTGNQDVRTTDSHNFLSKPQDQPQVNDSDSQKGGSGFVNFDSNVASSNVGTIYDVDFYKEFAQDIAHRQGKKVSVTVSENTDLALTKEVADAVKEISIQLLRNAIVHGIESPETRLANGKDETGHIAIAFAKQNQSLTISVKDDGKGIDYDAIRAILTKKSGHSQEVVNGFSENELISALFSSGFTTRDAADEDGGRGVGLDIVRQHIQNLNGKLKVNSESGQMAQFIISLPTTA